MKTIERVMRVMTHVNIGCAIGMVAWTAWSGVQVVQGRYPKPAPLATGAASPAAEQHLTHAPACCAERATRPAAEAGHHRRGHTHRALET